MRKFIPYIAILSGLLWILPMVAGAQNWKYIKEKNGVKLYTRQEGGRGLKYFRGVAEIKAPVEKIFSRLENINRTEWWTKDVTYLKVLLYEKDKQSQYYMVYHLPWPFKDRDLCVNATATINHTTGERTLTSVPLSGCAAASQRVRVKEYWQEWTLKPLDKNRTQVELEFFINPGTNLPDWIINMVLSDSPIRVIDAMRQHL